MPTAYIWDRVYSDYEVTYHMILLTLNLQSKAGSNNFNHSLSNLPFTFQINMLFLSCHIILCSLLLCQLSDRMPANIFLYSRYMCPFLHTKSHGRWILKSQESPFAFNHTETVSMYNFDLCLWSCLHNVGKWKSFFSIFLCVMLINAATWCSSHTVKFTCRHFKMHSANPETAESDNFPACLAMTQHFMWCWLQRCIDKNAAFLSDHKPYFKKTVNLLI